MAIKQETFKKLVFASSGLVMIGLFASFIWKMALGLGATIAIGVMLAVVMALLPAFSSWLTAIKFKAVKWVVDYAPVEALKARFQKLMEQLEEDAKILKQQKTGVEQLKTEAEDMIKEFPEEAEALNKRLAEREAMLSFRVAQFKKAKKATLDFGRSVRKAEMFYNIDKKDAELGFNKPGPDYMERFKEETAFAAIEKAAAESRAAMWAALNDINTVPEGETVKGITYTANNTVELGDILDVQAVRVKVERSDGNE